MAAFVAACGRPDAGHEGFSDEQWAVVKTLSPLPDVDGCPPETRASQGDGCERMAHLGQAIFCSPGYSGELEQDNRWGMKGETHKVSCASCHDPSRWFVDRPDLKASVGSGTTRRNTPTLLNVAYHASYFWSARFQSLSASLAVPLKAPVLNSSPVLLTSFLLGDATLTAEYTAIFGAPPTLDPGGPEAATVNVSYALEAYERRLLSRNAAFDRFVAGENDAISAAARRGLHLFITDALCIECHRGPHFTDDRLRVAGVPQEAGAPVDDGAFDNPLADGGVPSEDLRGRFRTPSLREVAMTPPYMHRGQLATLHDVIVFYNLGPQAPVPANIDRNLMKLDLSGEQMDDLEAFLRTLTGEGAPPPWNQCPP